MKLWAVRQPSMFLLFKMKRKLRRGKTIRTAMCLVVSGVGFYLFPTSQMVWKVFLGALTFHKIEREMLDYITIIMHLDPSRDSAMVAEVRGWGEILSGRLTF